MKCTPLRYRAYNIIYSRVAEASIFLNLHVHLKNFSRSDMSAIITTESLHVSKPLTIRTCIKLGVCIQ